ncbi:MAG: fibronectin type III domain-containing protein [Candidatus Omnitrophica bacterium]|nr:fibronectin type III domain-containing protein [Candidatus Omnitrophota bacterium]
MPAPSTPVLQNVDPGIAQVRLGWSTSSGATAYIVRYYKVVSGTSAMRASVQTAATTSDPVVEVPVGNVTNYTVQNLEENATYAFSVAATNGVVQSAPSNEMQAEVLSK